MTIEKLFVPYSIAVKLKELGFNEPCLTVYIPEQTEILDVFDCEESGYIQNSGTRKGVIAAPLYQQVEEWLMEEHRINILRFGIELWRVELPINFEQHIQRFYGELFRRDEAIEEVLKIIVAKI